MLGKRGRKVKMKEDEVGTDFSVLTWKRMQHIPAASRFYAIARVLTAADVPAVADVLAGNAVPAVAGILAAADVPNSIFLLFSPLLQYLCRTRV